VGNRIDPGFERIDANLQTLERLLGGPPLALIPPAGPAPDPARVAEYLAGPLARAALAPLLGAARPR
jgi:hypothetical protein